MFRIIIVVAAFRRLLVPPRRRSFRLPHRRIARAFRCRFEVRWHLITRDARALCVSFVLCPSPARTAYPFSMSISINQRKKNRSRRTAHGAAAKSCRKYVKWASIERNLTWNMSRAESLPFPSRLTFCLIRKWFRRCSPLPMCVCVFLRRSRTVIGTEI